MRALLAPERVRDSATERRVAEIVAAIRKDGDKALMKLARSLDRLEGPIEVSREEMERAAASVTRSVRTAIRSGGGGSPPPGPPQGG